MAKQPLKEYSTIFTSPIIPQRHVKHPMVLSVMQTLRKKLPGAGTDRRIGCGDSHGPHGVHSKVGQDGSRCLHGSCNGSRRSNYGRGTGVPGTARFRSGPASRAPRQSREPLGLLLFQYVAISIEKLIRTEKISQALTLDIDLHFGDGRTGSFPTEKGSWSLIFRTIRAQAS